MPSRTKSLTDVVFRPGDILMWSGRGCASRSIAWGTGTIGWKLRGRLFSHMSILSCEPGGPRVCNWESTTFCNIPCRIRGTVVSGVQCHDPYLEIVRYNGSVWLMRPVQALTEEKASALTAWLYNAIGTPYDYWQAGLAWTPHWVKRIGLLDADPTTLFCDEMVAFALKAIDVGPRSINPSKMSPAWYAWFLCHTATYRQPEKIWGGPR